jgi:hypothetical protein
MAHIFSDEVGTVTGLRQRVNDESVFDDYSVAVESLIFDANGGWLLIRRGSAAGDEVGKLEGIGGCAEESDDLRSELIREISEEIGDHVDIEILHFLEAKSDTTTKILPDGTEISRNWVIASFLCRLISGDPVVQEPDKNEGFERIVDLAVDPDRLSSSCVQSLATLQREWESIQKMVRSAEPR